MWLIAWPMRRCLSNFRQNTCQYWKLGYIFLLHILFEFINEKKSESCFCIFKFQLYGCIYAKIGVKVASQIEMFWMKIVLNLKLIAIKSVKNASVFHIHKDQTWYLSKLLRDRCFGSKTFTQKHINHNDSKFMRKQRKFKHKTQNIKQKS